MPDPDDQFMQCMEVWGGSEATDRGVVMAGLDAWVYSKPYGASAGGGDVYYVSSCATGRILRLLVADVSGHGNAVQGVAIDLRGLMRRYVNHLDHTQFVRSMNAQFSALSQAGCFATAVVSTFFAPTRRLTLCNAGHPLPLLYRGASRKWEYMESGKPDASPDPVNLPLGILDAGDYQTFDVPLRVGDLVLCYTDALVESRGPDGQMLGQEGLFKIVRSMDMTDPATLVPRLLEAVGSAYPANLTGDDVTVLLFRPNGLGARPGLGRQAAALGKLLAAIARRLAGGEPVPWPDAKIANVGGAVFRPLHRLWRSR